MLQVSFAVLSAALSAAGDKAAKGNKRARTEAPSNGTSSTWLLSRPDLGDCLLLRMWIKWPRDTAAVWSLQAGLAMPVSQCERMIAVLHKCSQRAMPFPGSMGPDQLPVLSRCSARTASVGCRGPPHLPMTLAEAVQPRIRAR